MHCVACTLYLGRVSREVRFRQKVDSTFRVGCGVFRIRTAHSMSVVGGFSAGTTGSISVSTSSIDRPEMSTGAGGGSANSVKFGRLSCSVIFRQKTIDKYLPRLVDTQQAANYALLQGPPPIPFQHRRWCLFALPPCMCKLAVQYRCGLSLDRSRIYARASTPCHTLKTTKRFTYLCHGQTATRLLSDSSISA